MAVKDKRANAQKNRYENGLYRGKIGMLKKMRMQKFAQLGFSQIMLFSALVPLYIHRQLLGYVQTAFYLSCLYHVHLF